MKKCRVEPMPCFCGEEGDILIVIHKQKEEIPIWVCHKCIELSENKNWLSERLEDMEEQLLKNREGNIIL